LKVSDFLVALVKISGATEALIHGSFEMFFSRLFCRCERTKKMKTSKSIVAVVFLLIITFLVMGATDLNHCRDDSIAQLKARLSSLEQRVKVLEKKLQTSTIKRSSVTKRLPGSSRDQSLPRGWRRKEFNGIPYYLVPLDQKQSHSRQRSSSKPRR
jgi:hypothetical protein